MTIKSFVVVFDDEFIKKWNWIILWKRCINLNLYAMFAWVLYIMTEWVMKNKLNVTMLKQVFVSVFTLLSSKCHGGGVIIRLQENWYYNL